MDFLYGNGGTDKLFDRSGQEFNARGNAYVSADTDGQWKEYAKATDKIWYVNASNTADVINVDFVTKPGLLEGHHLVTRLTNNNGNYTFAAQVRLDFQAVDNDGRRLWNPNEFRLKLDELRSADPEVRGDALSEPVDQRALEDLFQLPGEDNYLAILVDALDGDDLVTVGPTVQKTVWINGGRGNDRIQILSGNAILVDQTEQFVSDGPAPSGTIRGRRPTRSATSRSKAARGYPATVSSTRPRHSISASAANRR